MNNPVFKTRSRSGSRVAKKATSYRKEDEAIIFRLYGTDIVKVTPSVITLNSGRYRTMTTKRRINEISKELGLNFEVKTNRGEWVVSYGGAWYQFNDGMRIHR